MEIVFQMGGGIAAIPGLSRPTTIDTDELSAQEAATLAQLLADARFFDLPPSPPSYPKSADVRTYAISVVDGKRHHKVRLVDPVSDPALVALIDWLRTYSRAQRSRGNKQDC